MSLKQDYAAARAMVVQNCRPLLIILVSILLGNILGILGDQGLYLDDHMRRFFATHDLFPWYIGERNYIRPFFLYPMYKLIAISPYLARLVETLVFLVPVSCSWFLMLRYLFNLPITLALGAAILPAILPAQEAIPSFIDGCYTVQGMLTAMPVIFFGHLFIARKSWTYFLFAILFYALGLEMMDHTIFMAAPFGAYFVYRAYQTRTWKGLWLLPPIAVLAARKTLHAIHHPVTANQVTTLLPAEIIERFKVAFFQSNPFAFAMNWTLSDPAALAGVIASLLLLLAGLVFFIPKLRDCLSDDEKELPIYAIWALIWTAATSLPFILASPYYSSRYMHIAGYGSSLAILITIALFWNRIGSKRGFSVLVLTTLIGSALLRQVYLYRHFEPSNRHVQMFRAELGPRTFVENAQIVVTGGIAIPTGEFWHYSTGALQMYTQRNDITGNFGKERFFYNPFNAPEGMAFTFKMHGFDLKKPLYLFRFENDQFRPIEYALQWQEKTEEWKLHQWDLKSGTLVRSLTGRTLAELEKMIDTQKIARDAILWYHP